MPIPIYFTASTSQWVQFDEITSLQHHRSIKDTLFAFRTRSRNQYRNESLDDPCIINIARLDVLSIATRILAIVDHGERKRLLLDLQGSQAQSLLDLLQEILDAADLDTIRPPILRVLLEYRRGPGFIPPLLFSKAYNCKARNQWPPEVMARSGKVYLTEPPWLSRS